MLYICLYIYLISQKEISTEEIALIGYVIFFTLAIAAVFVVFFIAFQKRKNQLLLDKINQQKAFDEELLKTQQEIQEQTLSHVGRELHDNVGQMLVYATMQLNTVVKNAPELLKPKADEASSALKNSLAEVRALSKSLNADVIFNLGFEEILKNEVHRLNKLGEIAVNLKIEGEQVEFKNKQDQIILFRILQEFFSNSLKYSEADELEAEVDYRDKELSVTAEDNGNGFNMDNIKKGSGLINMEKRAQLINAEFTLSSSVNKGTKLSIVYPFRD